MNANPDNFIWAMFYANLVAMDRHPGHLKKDTFQGLDYLSTLADSMLEHYKARFGDYTDQTIMKSELPFVPGEIADKLKEK